MESIWKISRETKTAKRKKGSIPDVDMNKRGDEIEYKKTRKKERKKTREKQRTAEVRNLEQRKKTKKKERKSE